MGAQAWNRVEIMDGDSGFMGTLNLSGMEETDMAMLELAGMSGDLDFSVISEVDSSGDEDMTMLEIKVNGDAAMGYTLSMSGTESAGYMGDVKAMYDGMMMTFGTATKVTNGVSI